MKFKTMKFVALILIGLLTLLGSAHLTSAIPSDRIPEVTRSCLPDDDSFFRVAIGEVRFLAQTRYQGVDYYLFNVVPSDSSPSEGPGFPYVVSTSDQSCQRIYANPINENKWFSASMPQPVANQFSLAEYRLLIDLHGLDKFKREILPSFDRPQSPEDIWALEQLGLTLPNP
jgi:hypothetical protein